MLVLALACPASGDVTTDPTGGGQAQDNRQPYLGLNYLISSQGLTPPQNDPASSQTLVGGEPFLATIGLFAGNFAPRGWMMAEGQLLNVTQYQSLYSLLGTTFGGDGEATFALPDLRGRLPVHAGTAAGLSPRTLGQEFGVERVTLSMDLMPSHNHRLYSVDDVVLDNVTTSTAVGGSLPHDNMQPSVALNYCIALDGVAPPRNIPVPGGSQGDADLSTGPLLGEVSLFASNFEPDGWAYCNGQLLQIAQNLALFDVLGSTYGGDGVSTFALPDMRGRTAIGAGNGPGLTDRPLGQKSGEEETRLTSDHSPRHTHTVSPPPIGIDNAWGDRPRTNMQPSEVLSFIISLQGTFPPRSIPIPDEASAGDRDDAGGTLGEVTMFAGDFAPAGWAICQGQLLPIAQNTPLYSILGTTYGGDGRTTFALPDLRGRAPIQPGQGPGLSTYQLGQKGGTDTGVLTEAQLPSHTHSVPTMMTWDGAEGGSWTGDH